MPRGSASKKTALASEQERPDIARRRQRWKTHQGSIDLKRLVFIDETRAKTNMAPLRGWAMRGKRLIGHAPFGHWNTMTFVAALRCDGITAPWVIDGPINGGIFQTYVAEVLAPTLRPDDIAILDNLGSHKAPAIRNAIRAAGARLLFLPAYSPDLNPIEQVFAKLKHLLRKAEERSKQAVWRRIGTLLDQFTPKECENYLRNSGYGSA
jgi:transposase